VNMVLSILSPIIVFGLVIFVHELGHFLAAKSVGVYTPRFSIGFGPALWRRRRGETEYILAAFPLGGYVRMASRHDEASAFLEGGSEEELAKKIAETPDYDPNAMIPFGPHPVPENRWFESKPLWARLYILLAGVFMNFVLGWAVCVAMVAAYGEAVLPMRVVGAVRPINGQPVIAAIQPGDTIVSVNGETVRNWSAAERLMVGSQGRVDIGTNRGTTSVALDAPGAPSGRDVALALDPESPAIIGEMLPGQPAAKAGLKTGDTVTAIDGAAVRSWTDMVEVVAGSADKPLRFEVSRGGTREAVTVTPTGQEGVHPFTGERGQVGKIGAYQPDVSAREPVAFGRAVELGTRTAVGLGAQIIITVKRLMTREERLDQLGGPIAITRAAVQAARAGLENVLFLIALLSINVGILNLLPIPILDGGQVLISILETARGRAFSMQTREYILRGGLFVILLLFVVVMFNDTRAIVALFR
jgi:regulator of sigma E protease